MSEGRQVKCKYLLVDNTEHGGNPTLTNSPYDQHGAGRIDTTSWYCGQCTPGDEQESDHQLIRRRHVLETSEMHDSNVMGQPLRSTQYQALS